MDAQAVTLGECLEDEAACVGVGLALGYLPVVAVEGKEIVVQGPGRRIRLRGEDGRDLQPRWSEISVRGTYLGANTIEVEHAIKHRWRAVKKAVGLLTLSGWLLLVGRAWRRGGRRRG